MSLIDLLIPPICVNCGKAGESLCQDCRDLIDILYIQFCPGCGKRTPETCKSCIKSLNGIYCASSYQNRIVRKAIDKFRYEPFVKDLAKPLSSLIIAHFLLLEKLPSSDHLIIPVPLHKKRLKWRGFNQAEEIARELSQILDIALEAHVLLRGNKSLPQTELSPEEKKTNVKGAFLCEKLELIKGRKVLLIDDVYTTGSTMQECALTLKEAGAREVWGVVVARE